MNYEIIEYNNINEKVYQYSHSSGLKAFVIPKKGYQKKYATFATNYGSIVNRFIIPGQSEEIRVPDGIAHFLEHKLFEQEDGSVMDKFSALGSNPNAYTSFNQTVYLFSCTDKFHENFELLLNYVQNPYLTDENVEKEKGIIGQEIRMYQDNPEWRVYFNLLAALYKNHPVKIDIAGTIESIADINKENLYLCYNTFYHPSNMVIIVVGDVDPDKVFENIEKAIKVKTNPGEIKRIFEEEPEEINSPNIEQKLSVSIPLFYSGIKDTNFPSQGKDVLKREATIKIILDIIMGRSSELYDKLYNKGLINSSFGFDYTIESNYAFSSYGGQSSNPMEVKNIISEEINRLLINGLDKNSFERIRKSHKGNFVKNLNSVEAINHNFNSLYFKGVNYFDYYDIFDKMEFEDVNKLFKEHFSKQSAISIINPV